MRTAGKRANPGLGAARRWGQAARSPADAGFARPCPQALTTDRCQGPEQHRRPNIDTIVDYLLNINRTCIAQPPARGSIRINTHRGPDGSLRYFPGVSGALVPKSGKRIFTASTAFPEDALLQALTGR